MPVADLTERAYAELVSLHGRRAVVTGGRRGLGSGIAHRLAEAGAVLVVGDLDATSARTTADDIARRYAVAALGTGLDVSVAASALPAGSRGSPRTRSPMILRCTSDDPA
jgi:NAD(P)-dependent dehydrogenase (short-subunit alcohol dehydrogenase family)